MAETGAKSPVKTERREKRQPSALEPWRPLSTLRREIQHLFDDFDRGFWGTPFRRSFFDVKPFWRREASWRAAPAVDVIEKDDAYEISAELPGLDEKNIEVKLAGGDLMIKGEKQEEKEEKEKDYYLRERRFGSCERHFSVPDGVDAGKIEASFKKGVLTVTLPKKPEAQKPAKKIEVKAT